MAKKKIMLFIVEGPTDETSISTILSRIFSSATVRFQVVHGDVLTQDFVASNEIVNAVSQQIQDFCGSIYSSEDFCGVVHLTDMDGVYIPDDAVVEEAENGKVYPFYGDTQILTPDPAGIKDRNRRKRNNIARLSRTKRIWTIPYSFYYFSCNLDHVLHGQHNLSNDEKTARARSFDLAYADNPNAFIRFMKEESFAVHGTYSETWNFIKKEYHSLGRYSNFGILLPDSCEWSAEHAQ